MESIEDSTWLVAVLKHAKTLQIQHSNHTG